MKKHMLSAFLLIGALSGSLGVEAKRRGVSEVMLYEKDVWAKGLPAARKRLWLRQPLTVEEQMYFDSLKNRVGAGAVAAVLAMVYEVGKWDGFDRRRLISADELNEFTQKAADLLRQRQELERRQSIATFLEEQGPLHFEIDRFNEDLEKLEKQREKIKESNIQISARSIISGEEVLIGQLPKKLEKKKSVRSFSDDDGPKKAKKHSKTK